MFSFATLFMTDQIVFVRLLYFQNVGTISLKGGAKGALGLGTTHLKREFSETCSITVPYLGVLDMF